MIVMIGDGGWHLLGRGQEAIIHPTVSGTVLFPTKTKIIYTLKSQ